MRPCGSGNVKTSDIGRIRRGGFDVVRFSHQQIYPDSHQGKPLQPLATVPPAAQARALARTGEARRGARASAARGGRSRSTRRLQNSTAPGVRAAQGWRGACWRSRARTVPAGQAALHFVRENHGGTGGGGRGACGFVVASAVPAGRVGRRVHLMRHTDRRYGRQLELSSSISSAALLTGVTVITSNQRGRVRRRHRYIGRCAIATSTARGGRVKVPETGIVWSTSSQARASNRVLSRKSRSRWVEIVVTA
jgi:hypothetical protein